MHKFITGKGGGQGLIPDYFDKSKIVPKQPQVRNRNKFQAWKQYSPAGNIWNAAFP